MIQHHAIPKITNYLLILLVLLFLGACSQQSQAPSPEASTPETINASLESLAKLFAKAATDSSVRQHIQQEVGKRFDGDTNVLYKTLAMTQLQAQGGSVDIRQALANAYTQSGNLTSQAGGALEAVDTLTNSIPRLQVAVPEVFDTWNAQSYTPLVGYVPAGVDDKTIKEIKAFDSEGKEHIFGAGTPPTQAVIILSQNERTDDAGQLLAQSEDSGTSDGKLEVQAYSYQVKMGTVELYDDHEPWFKGDPEIWLIAQALTTRPELATRQSFDGANSEDYRYVYNRYLGNTRHDVVFYWYEKDGSSYDISITVRGVTLGFKIDDSDDPYGYITVPHASLAGTSSTYYDLGGLEFSAY